MGDVSVVRWMDGVALCSEYNKVEQLTIGSRDNVISMDTTVKGHLASTSPLFNFLYLFYLRFLCVYVFACCRELFLHKPECIFLLLFPLEEGTNVCDSCLLLNSFRFHVFFRFS